MKKIERQVYVHAKRGQEFWNTPYPTRLQTEENNNIKEEKDNGMV